MSTLQVEGIGRADMLYREPNSVSNMADAQLIVLAFQGRPYPFPDPADCSDLGRGRRSGSGSATRTPIPMLVTDEPSRAALRREANGDR